MVSYLERFDQTPVGERWLLVRGWMFEESLPFFKELRRHRPILPMREATLVARYNDCRDILLRHDAFSVALYRPKQGGYWMAQDDTPQHWREKGIMQAVLDREQIPAIRAFIAETAANILQQANGQIEAVRGLTRAVPIALVQEKFGFGDADPEELLDWSHWNQYDAFHNQPFDSIAVRDPAAIVAKREAANLRMRDYLVALVKRRAAELKSGQDNRDMISRLIRLSASGALQFDIPSVVLNIGGLLIGAVETTSQAVVHSLAQLLGRPEALAGARAALVRNAVAEADGYVFEALRFHPISPYMFRVCEQRTMLAGGTDYQRVLEPGTIVLPLVQSAMFDETSFVEPGRFDPGRSRGNTFHLGLGIHQCLGLAIGEIMIPEIVQQCLRRPGLEAIAPIDYGGGPFPETYRLRWNVDGHSNDVPASA